MTSRSRKRTWRREVITEGWGDQGKDPAGRRKSCAGDTRVSDGAAKFVTGLIKHYCTACRRVPI